MDEHGIRNAEGSHHTKKLVLTRDDNLRFRSVTLQTKYDLSTDDSKEDPRFVETKRIQGSYGFERNVIAQYLVGSALPPSKKPLLHSALDHDQSYVFL